MFLSPLRARCRPARAAWYGLRAQIPLRARRLCQGVAGCLISGLLAPVLAAAPLPAPGGGGAVASPPSLPDTVLSLVQTGYDQPDLALRALQALPATAAQPAPQGGPALHHRWVLLGQGLVLAGAGRSTDSAAVASALRGLAAAAASAGAAAVATAADTLPTALAEADAHLVQAVLADTQGQSQQVMSAALSAMALYRQACPREGVRDATREPAGTASTACDHRPPWRALLLLARHGGLQGQGSAARTHALQAAELARTAGDAGLQAWALALAADLSAGLGENDLAQRQFAQARRLASLQGGAHTRARLAIYDTRMRSRSGDLAGARRAAETGLLQADRARSPRLRAVLLANLSDIHVKAGRPKAALLAVEQALPTARQYGDLRLERVLMANAGLARIGLGQRAQARQTLDELLAAFGSAGASADRATVLREFADALAASGDLKGALELYHQERRLDAELTAANRHAAMAELQARYERSAQQRRLEQLARDNSLIDTQLANRQTLQRLWALGAVVLTLAGVLMALMYRRVREINRQLASSHASLQVQSQRDPLTGLANRRCLHERAADAAAVQGALLLVDIDHFKRINDSQGHAGGDAVLVDVAQRLAAAVRPDDLVVRWGGEEFLIYAPRLDADATRALASRVLRAVGSRPVVLPGAAGRDVDTDTDPDGTGIVVTASVGFACFPLPPGQPGLPMDRAINLADMALYTAKNQGRNRAVGIARVQAADDAALRAVEADFDSAWREARVVLDILPGPQLPPSAPVPPGPGGGLPAAAAPGRARATAVATPGAAAERAASPNA